MGVLRGSAAVLKSILIILISFGSAIAEKDPACHE